MFSFNGRIGRKTFFLTMLGWVGTYIVIDRLGLEILGIAILPWYLWLGIASQVKRWHDRSKSGWMVVVNLLPVVGWIWACVELYFLRGIRGPNRYGSDPAQPTAKSDKPEVQSLEEAAAGSIDMRLLSPRWLTMTVAVWLLLLFGPPMARWLRFQFNENAALQPFREHLTEYSSPSLQSLLPVRDLFDAKKSHINGKLVTIDVNRNDLNPLFLALPDNLKPANPSEITSVAFLDCDTVWDRTSCDITVIDLSVLAITATIKVERPTAQRDDPFWTFWDSIGSLTGSAPAGWQAEMLRVPLTREIVDMFTYVSRRSAPTVTTATRNIPSTVLMNATMIPGFESGKLAIDGSGISFVSNSERKISRVAPRRSAYADLEYCMFVDNRNSSRGPAIVGGRGRQVQSYELSSEMWLIVHPRGAKASDSYLVPREHQEDFFNAARFFGKHCG
jgi:uncharacterized membrane protein YhaH (DUF805 family)